MHVVLQPVGNHSIIFELAVMIKSGGPHNFLAGGHVHCPTNFATDRLSLGHAQIYGPRQSRDLSAEAYPDLLQSLLPFIILHVVSKSSTRDSPRILLTALFEFLHQRPPLISTQGISFEGQDFSTNRMQGYLPQNFQRACSSFTAIGAINLWQGDPIQRLGALIL